MQPLQLFETAFRQNEWLARRQAVVASNIANVNTPGYRAKDVESFDAVMRASLEMTKTAGSHLAPSGGGEVQVRDTRNSKSDVTASGNDVNLEGEFLKTGEIMRGYSMNTQILKAFSRMLQSVAKG